MSNLRPNSVCDTTPLQRLESQSSCSEPSSPTFHGSCIEPTSVTSIENNSLTTPESCADTTDRSSEKSKLPIPQVSVTNYNNNIKIEMPLGKMANCNGHNKQNGLENGVRKICCRILLDFLILCCVGLPILGLHLWGRPYQRGFFCDDNSLKHPYHESTMYSWLLYLMGFVIPITIIMAVEFFISNAKRMQHFENLTAERFYISHLQIPDWIIECYKKIGVLIFGAAVGVLTTDIAKYSIGRLRPHFFAICQPIMPDGTKCADPINADRFIESYTCTGTATSKILRDVHLSFPSGHSNFVFFTMIYITIYLQTRMTWRRSKMFKHLLQFLFLMFAWYTALTRVSDYKHHWTDVLAGSMIGSLYAVLLTSSMW